MGSQIGPVHGEDADAAEVEEALYRRPRTDEAGTGTKLSVSSAREGDHAPEPGLGPWTLLNTRWRMAFVYPRSGARLASLRVLSWRVSSTMEAPSRETLQTLGEHGKRKSQYGPGFASSTGADSPACLADNGIDQHGRQGSWRTTVRRALWPPGQRQIRGCVI